MQYQIEIESNTLTDAEVKEFLTTQLYLNRYDIELEVRTVGVKYRGTPDPTVLVAIVGVAGPAIGALVSGLLEIWRQRLSGTIRFETKEGAVLEIPADTQPEKIDLLIEKLKQMSITQIILP